MKILLAVHHFPPRYSAGAELYTFRLARWLNTHGHTAEVVCVETLDADRPAGVTVAADHYEGVPVWRLTLGLQGAPNDWSYANPMVTEWIEQHMAAWQPHLFHLHSGYLIGAGALGAAQCHGIPTVLTLHDYWFLCPRITLLRSDGQLCAAPPADPAACSWCLKQNFRRYRLPEQLSGGAAGRVWIALASAQGRDEQANRRAYLRQALSQVDLAIAPSHFLAGMFQDLIAPERLQVVRLGIDTARLKVVPPPGAAPTLQLGYIGQIAAHKGVHVIVAALQRLPRNGRPVHLRIFGDPEQHPAYVQKLRAQIGDDPRITFAGRFPNGQIADVFTNIDALVVPSLWYENSPLSILEAQAARRPVIASNFGGMAELVRDEVDGLLFRAGDAADLARQIQRLRTEAGLLERLHAGIGPTASVDDEMAQLYATYERVLAAHPVEANS